MICKMCLKDKPLIKAHVIPAAFYRYMKKDDRPLEIRSIEKGVPKRRSYTGIYDKNILCEDCERLFQKYDDYAQKLLLPDPKGADHIIGPDGQKEGYKVNNVNYHCLKLFFLSLLWRASASVREEFSKVNTGPFEEELRHRIRRDDPGNRDYFSVTILRFDHVLGKNFLLDPHKTRINSLNYYVFYLSAGYKAYIKVDKRPLTGPLASIVLSPQKPLYIPFDKEFLKSKDFNILSKIVKNYQK